MLRIRNKRENVKNVENIYIVAKDYSFKIGVKKYLKNRKIVFLVPRVDGGEKGGCREHRWYFMSLFLRHFVSWFIFVVGGLDEIRNHI